MNFHYTDERNVQMLIYLMKKKGIRKVVASPGTTNISFLASIQSDPFFEIISSVDERSAAYIACGMAAESGETVALTCTGATASRNYLPGLTEAFYRKLPILAITSTQPTGRVGQNIPQVIDRSIVPIDAVKMTVQIPMIRDDEDYKACNILINKALLEIRHNGIGPVHVNLTTMYSKNFSVKNLPKTRNIERFTQNDTLPELKSDHVGIYVGAHVKWSKQLSDAVDLFCKGYNAVVFCDQTSNYKGQFAVPISLVCNQDMYRSSLRTMDVMIHIGEVSGAYSTMNPKAVWRVSDDGELKDTFGKLKNIFQMSELNFFELYSKNVKNNQNDDSYLRAWKLENEELYNNIPKLPFSNIWIAEKMSSKLPEKSVLHLGILNSLRSWNFFEVPKSVLGYSNTGGFGIDGGVSSLVGASIADPSKLFFGVFGDLAFFYDLNVNGNRFIGNNIRILLINNGGGMEFKNYNNEGSMFGKSVNDYIAASGHFGNKSRELVKDFVENLGFQYISADSKDEFMNKIDLFTTGNQTSKPLVFEVFTNSEDESRALWLMRNIKHTHLGRFEHLGKKVLGDKGIRLVKHILNK
ncbi:thiamine pyrophosphate-binding protein [Companilactobacillus nantensis]|nr:thiamine pyrophosphate-binding protein [Companilactobacillus nantensis]GEO64388.1 2-succinyl-5-enolpyruvyl-6-hydroxy-3-cyclohexene- 1-carboxylate synthase [Companilactobacillus nantensis]